MSLQEADSLIDKNRGEFKQLRKKYTKLLRNSLNHEKLKKAHASLPAQQKKEPIVTSNVGVTCS